ncbi:hypothetical protein GCM10023195_76850 [Actinoallomurus liliacearum]|uniref:DUF1918 domain-containing protein n=1 Tax=Actinoallomurus liliacearum TaxID=1080073 RepID=A0ABP8TYE1_9ACTN
MADIEIGTAVRHRTWTGTTGTVVGIDGPWLSVAWHNSCVIDELKADDVDVWADAPAELREWRGGLGRLGGITEPYRVVPVTGGL